MGPPLFCECGFEVCVLSELELLTVILWFTNSAFFLSHEAIYEIENAPFTQVLP